ncbi:MAG: biotin/lipoyl-containing protein [Myxococcota bacterium]
MLLTVEAMKMEHALKAPRRSKVLAVRCAAGDQVVPGAALCELEDAP